MALICVVARLANKHELFAAPRRLASEAIAPETRLMWDSFRGSLSSAEALLVVQTEPVVAILAERGPAPKPEAFVQADGSQLVDAGFQPQHRDSALPRIFREVAQHHLAQAHPAECGSYVHALELGILHAVELHAAAGRRGAIATSNEERDGFAQQLLHRVSVATFLRVAPRAEMRIKLGDEREGVAAVGPRFGDLSRRHEMSQR